MPSCKLLITTLIGCLVVVAAMPQDKDQGTFLFGLPFLQLKDGGVRVNFGGYHAEAGLGGLLTGSRTGGGLHASAGTPWGAHAGAGLGGDLGGNDASAGGGLYARAGLGEGRPEAAAGLGGRLDGSGRSAAPASGGLFAGATLGDQILSTVDGGAGASSFGSADAGAKASASAGASGSAAARKPQSSRSSIQIVARSEKGSDKSKSERASGDEVPKDTKYKETQREILVPGFGAEAGIFGAVFADGSVEKVKVKNVGQIESVPAAPRVPLGENHVISSDSGTTGGGPHWIYTPDIPAPFWAQDYLPTKYQPSSFIKNRDFIYYVPAVDVKVYRRQDRPRWHFKKRFWAGPRKQVIYYTEDDSVSEPKSGSSVK